MKENVMLSKLYYRYGRMSNEDINKYLDKILLVKESEFGYNVIPRELFKETVRKTALNFIPSKEAKGLDNLVPYKKFYYLVKSSSRFIIKPDAGEIFDQIDVADLNDPALKAICVKDAYEAIDGTDGEHFLMHAFLLKERKSPKILVQIKGGTITDVFTDSEIQIIIVDLDNGSVEKEETTNIGDNTFVSLYDEIIDPTTAIREKLTKLKF